MKRTVLFFLAVVSCLTALAQTPTKPKAKYQPKQDGFAFPVDTAIAKLDSMAGKPVIYPEIKREDVIYSKRIWRVVDYRLPGNDLLNSPKQNLLKVIYEAVSKGELELHGVTDESFKKEPISSNKPSAATTTTAAPSTAKNAKNTKTVASKPAAKAAAVYSAVDTAFLGVNRNTEKMNRASEDDAEFFAKSFMGIRIKEDWILDGKRGVFQPRIVGIAPIRMDIKTQNDDGSPLAKPDTAIQVVGWLRYEELRPILAAAKISNDENDNSNITFDDIFNKRLFYSYITKASNSKDLRIEDMTFATIDGKVRPFTLRERLLEGERIKKEMANMEQGLWEY